MHTQTLKQRVDLVALQTAQRERFPLLLQTTSEPIQATARYDLLLGCASEAARIDRDALQWLDEFRAAPTKEIPQQLPFLGGWAIYAGYELAEWLEPRLKLPEARLESSSLPRLWVQRCDLAVIYDHQQGRTHVVIDRPDEIAEPVARELIKQIGQLCPNDNTTSTARVDLQEDAPECFLRAVERIRDYILAGDVFQVNLSRAWRGRLELAPEALYRRLATTNPAPFAALAQIQGTSIISSSPERLVQIRGTRIETRPIAGTRPRGAQPERERGDLLQHPKERAEHVMLVDLERNDLGKLCKPGSVRVDELMGLESYAHVHHIVSNITGELREDWTPGAVLRSVFPGGTITGCPKIRCMEIIAELEGEGRAAYTGALGYLDRRGHLDLNILIRSLVMRDGQIAFRTGAGIVADSVPELELAETRAKARGLLNALGLAP